jgi:hypothetical protein
MKRLLTLLVTLGLVSLFVVACGRGTSAGASSGGSSGSSVSVTDVHMGTQSFLQNSVTIKQGSSLKLINDASDMHIISLGQWVNGSPKPEKEPGAPQVNNLQFSGDASHVIGPWNTAGTYHL